MWELKQYYLQQREAEAANPQEKFDFSQMKEAVNSGLMYRYLERTMRRYRSIRFRNVC